MAHDAGAGVGSQHPLKAKFGLGRAVGHDDHAGVNGVADSHAAAVMDGHPRGPGGGVEQGIQDGPVGDGVAAVPHGLGLAVGGGHRPGVQVVTAEHHGCLEFARFHHPVHQHAQAVPLAIAQPADSGGKPLEVDLLARQADPASQRGVILELAQHHVVNAGDVGRIARQHRPAEGPASAAEERPDEGGDEAGEVEGVRHPAGQGLGPNVVAIVEDDDAPLLEVQHGLDMQGHGVHGALDVLLGILRPEIARLLQGQPGGNIAVQGVVSGGLVRHEVGQDAAPEDLGVHLGGVADQPDGFRDAPALGGEREIQRLVQVRGHDLAVAGLDPLLDSLGIHLHRQDHAVVHGDGQRLGPAHAAQAGGQD